MSAHDFTRSFALDYDGARVKFQAAARGLGCMLSVYTHRVQKGPQGQEMAIDVARLGDAQAPSQLVIVSGTHGLEGLSGSAAQIGWIQSSFARALPADVSVLFIHAINPYGFAWATRTTENNVDLNRNFIDFAKPIPANPGYAALRCFVPISSHWWEDTTEQAISITQQAVEGLASWPLSAAA